MRKKSETFEKFKEFENSVTNESGCNIGTLRTDNGGEYISNEFEEYLKARGIRHELTVPHSPQQNGVAERMNRTLMESATTMIAHAKLPNSFWAEAVATASYIRNRLPTTAFKTPSTQTSTLSTQSSTTNSTLSTQPSTPNSTTSTQPSTPTSTPSTQSSTSISNPSPQPSPQTPPPQPSPQPQFPTPQPRPLPKFNPSLRPQTPPLQPSPRHQTPPHQPSTQPQTPHPQHNPPPP